MSESHAGAAVLRPALCPFCHAKAVDTLAKVLTVQTLWRCRQCEGTWTIARQPASSGRRWS